VTDGGEGHHRQVTDGGMGHHRQVIAGAGVVTPAPKRITVSM
jgi:hypothetical protein